MMMMHFKNLEWWKRCEGTNDKFQYTFFSLEGKKRKTTKNIFCCSVGDAWFLWVFVFWSREWHCGTSGLLPKYYYYEHYKLFDVAF